MSKQPRKILVSPGYGAGWTTWAGGGTEVRKFMLEYPPFVAFLEGGGTFTGQASRSRDKDYEEMPIVQQFLADFAEKFPEEEAPYLGGLRDLQVRTVHGLVRIEEYDGSESVIEQGSDEGWV